MQSIAEKLIILQGNPNIGKTTTLLRVIDFLKKARGFVPINHPGSGKDQRVLLKNDQGFSVAICTAGDSLEVIEENYCFFLNTECNVMISACSINVETHMNGSRTNLMKTALIGFASGYWKSAEVQTNEDSEHVKIFTLYSQEDVGSMVQGVVEEVLVDW
jgi:hypothetical protein